MLWASRAAKAALASLTAQLRAKPLKEGYQFIGDGSIPFKNDDTNIIILVIQNSPALTRGLLNNRDVYVKMSFSQRQIC